MTDKEKSAFENLVQSFTKIIEILHKTIKDLAEQKAKNRVLIKERDDWQLIARKIAIMQTYTDMCYGCSAAESGFCDYYGDNTIKLGSKNCVDAIIKQAKVEIDEDKKTEV